MKITVDLLYNFNLENKELLEWFNEKYPFGANISDIIQNNAPIELLYFLKKYFNFTSEENEQYEKLLKISNSSFYYGSNTISNSEHIVSCFDVENSSWIQRSSNIKNSSYIYDSEEVVNSNNIWNCKNIYNSNKVINSQSIINSSELIYSDNISWSKEVNSSSYIDESIGIYRCKNLTNSFFCGFCNNLKNSMFCLNFEDDNYFMFNKPVTAIEFERVKEELLYRLQEEEFNFIKIDDSKYYPKDRYDFRIRFDCLYENLSADFFGWVGTLPNYSEELFLSLFFKTV